MKNQNQQIKVVLAEMFAWFHQFCQENHLRYYILGGTMLGAVRHQGFIPWDDDVDVGMPRADFQRMEQLLRESPNDIYVLETPNSEKPDFFYTFGKLYDTRTTLVENTRVPVKRGVYLDIFPLDGAGDSREEGLKLFAPIKRRMELLLAMTTGIRKGRKFYKNAGIIALRCIPWWVLDPKNLLHDIQRRCARKDFDCCAWISNYSGAYWEKEIMPRAVFGEPTEYIFENMRVYGVRDYEAYLTSLYGDWRQLPPVEKRVSHHDTVSIDLNKSYLEA